MAHTFFTICGRDILVRQGLLTSTLDLAFRLAANTVSDTSEASRFIEFAELAVRADDEGAGTMHYPIDAMIDRGEIALDTFVGVMSSALDEAKCHEEFIPKERLAELGVPSSLLFDLAASNVVKFCEEVLDATSEANPQ